MGDNYTLLPFFLTSLHIFSWPQMGRIYAVAFEVKASPLVALGPLPFPILPQVTAPLPAVVLQHDQLAQPGRRPAVAGLQRSGCGTWASWLTSWLVGRAAGGQEKEEGWWTWTSGCRSWAGWLASGLAPAMQVNMVELSSRSSSWKEREDLLRQCISPSFLSWEFWYLFSQKQSLGGKALALILCKEEASREYRQHKNINCRYNYPQHKGWHSSLTSDFYPIQNWQ